MGQLMPEGVNRCPNCGCPVENAPAEQKATAQPAQETPEVEQQRTDTVYVFPTTDTGTKYEDTIKTYTDVIWWLNVVVVAFLVICTFAYNLMYFPVFVFVGALYLLILYVMLAFIRVFRNISINLREINLKTKG
ncbi:MAG: hypothetical protein IKI60_00375 [Alloprevotella sp.]|nr:hypothetical protein [Alloprevotella sp.]